VECSCHNLAKVFSPQGQKSYPERPSMIEQTEVFQKNISHKKLLWTPKVQNADLTILGQKFWRKVEIFSPENQN